MRVLMRREIEFGRILGAHHDVILPRSARVVGVRGVSHPIRPILLLRREYDHPHRLRRARLPLPLPLEKRPQLLEPRQHRLRPLRARLRVHLEMFAPRQSPFRSLRGHRPKSNCPQSQRRKRTHPGKQDSAHASSLPSCIRITMRIYAMLFEWDAQKERSNIAKHGFSFDAARRVFDDEFCLIYLDRLDEAGESRWHAIGAVSLSGGGSAVLLVVHVYRENLYGEEITRIVSARAAEKGEIRRYREQAPR